ncbi:hypothetical protein [Paenibacillus sp. Mc5Re-14]|uniref:hypothetical protein n=1 Tax=Paenibacillus sp. Mc5Re-14 TaxID=1030529 RepID=UPI000AB6548F|nr:hypothetical protein [Paenibacillus sp. Mc5Re-14]
MGEAKRKFIEAYKNDLNLNATLEKMIGNLDDQSSKLKEMTKSEKYKESYHLLKAIISDCQDVMAKIELKLDGDVELVEEFQLTDADEYFSR